MQKCWDHGKCVAPHSRLVLTDGTIETAENLSKKAEEFGIKFEEKEDQIIYDVKNLGLNVFSLNKNNGKLEKKPIELAWKSSKIEGNTYSLLGTEALIKNNVVSKGKTADETQMILNHKDAFNEAIQNKERFRKLNYVFNIFNIR